MHSPLPLTRDLVLIGGGHAHALVLLKWGMNPLPGARLTLINPGPTAPYTGMLPGFVAGHYSREALEIDLVRLARFAGARLILGAATSIDRNTKEIHVPDRPPIRYDVAAIDVGITSDMPNLPGFTEFGIAAKPLGSYAARWTEFVDACAARRAEPQVCVIGAGVAGVELALAMSHRLRSVGCEPEVRIVDRSAALEGLTGGARAKLFESLRRADIVIHENADIAEVRMTDVLLSSGRAIPSHFTVGAAGAKPHDWLQDTGLEHLNGYLRVDKFLRSINDPDIYASGDCAHLDHAPRPKAGVFAVRQAPILAHNIRASLAGGSKKAYAPQKDFLKLISLGGKTALADYYGTAPSGDWLWRVKDRIDRTFMDKLDKLPSMPKPQAPLEVAYGVRDAMAGAPLCGGCGAKLGGATLSGALTHLPAPERDDVLSLPGDDAAVLAMGSDWQVMTTDHLRGFSLDPVVQTRITALHALGDIWAMGAAPQAATANVILPPMSEPLQASALRDILATAAEVFTSQGAELVGGHSSEGAELTIGFTITGLRESYPIGHDGAQPGDRLLMTRGLGSGTILAAEMQQKAPGEIVAAMTDILMTPQAGSAQIIVASQGLHAMTDITGFGLAGHLNAICKASDTGAEVRLMDVPLLEGALDLAQAGIRSSLFPANKSALAAQVFAPDTARADLLFDPQTAGGLLAVVDAAHADRLVAELRAANCEVWDIGKITNSPGVVVSA